MTDAEKRPIAAFVVFVRQYCPEVRVAYATDGTQELGDRARLDDWERAAVWREPERERR